MVASFLAASRGQMPEAAFQKRVEEWTPEVSAHGWARALAQLADGNPERDVILVAEVDDGDLLGLASGGAAEREVNFLCRKSCRLCLHVSVVRRCNGTC
ncbi:MAG TPA: hypothetical protein VME46_13640 [Acidimicrobiales bacterium]|nr:hypothetical protein [Acidimicrobiales bacterium]